MSTQDAETMTLELDAETEARMVPLWAAADRALRRDPHMLADLAELARDAVAEKERDVERERLRKAARARANEAARAKRAALSPEERDRLNQASRAAYAAKVSQTS